jgi:hypothetical protein
MVLDEVGTARALREPRKFTDAHKYGCCLFASLVDAVKHERT